MALVCDVCGYGERLFVRRAVHWHCVSGVPYSCAALYVPTSLLRLCTNTVTLTPVSMGATLHAEARGA